MRTVTLILFGLALTGCASSAQIAAMDDQKCRSYGSAPGSPAYVQCRTQLDTTRTTARTMRIIAASN